jgi:hypothetical protein
VQTDVKKPPKRLIDVYCGAYNEAMNVEELTFRQYLEKKFHGIDESKAMAYLDEYNNGDRIEPVDENLLAAGRAWTACNLMESIMAGVN